MVDSSTMIPRLTASGPALYADAAWPAVEGGPYGLAAYSYFGGGLSQYFPPEGQEQQNGTGLSTMSAFYVFLGEAIDDPNALSDGLKNLSVTFGEARARSQTPAQAAMLAVWIENPNAAPVSWNTFVLLSAPTKPTVGPNPNLIALKGGMAFAIPASGNGVYRCSAEGAYLDFAITAPFVGQYNPDSRMTAVVGATKLVAESTRIYLTGPKRGTVVADFPSAVVDPVGDPYSRLAPIENSKGDLFSVLGASVGYALKTRSGFASAAAEVFEGLPSRVLGGCPVPLRLSVDPLRLRDHARTRFDFNFPETPVLLSRPPRTTTQPAVIKSTLRSTFGEMAYLRPSRVQPLPRGAGFVLDLALDRDGSGVLTPVPDGSFDLVWSEPVAVQGDPTFKIDGPSAGTKPRRLMLGTSGVEYLELPAGQCTLQFQPGQPACAEDGTFTSRATTAYVALTGPTGTASLPYYAQSPHAPLFKPVGGGALEFWPLAAARLKPPAAGVGGGFPLLPVAGLAAGAADAAEVELSAVAPRRHALIVAQDGTSARDLAPAVPPSYAVTGAGTVVELSKDGSAMLGLMLANLPASLSPDGKEARVEVSPVPAKLQAALLSSRPFIVVSDPGALTPAAPKAAQPAPGSTTAPTSPTTSSPGYQAPAQPSEGSSPSPDSFLSKRDAPQAAPAAKWAVKVDGWTVDFSPAAWRTGTERPTVMLLKYGGGSLEDLVADAGTWGWPEAAGGGTPATGRLTLAQTQAAVQNLFDAAKIAPEGDPRRHFYTEVVADPSWRGTLVLNAAVAATSLPEDLHFMAAGLAEGFVAHHLALSLTTIGADVNAPGVTEVAGLVAYDDPQDLVADAAPTAPAAAFKAKRLSVSFAHSAVVAVRAEVELMLNRLFGSALAMTDPRQGNNLVMSAEAHAGAGPSGYSFHLDRSNRYDVEGSPLSSVEVSGVRLSAATSAPDTAGATTTTARFVLSGRLRFVEYDAFDPFCYGETVVGTELRDGYLAYDGLLVTMRFTESAAKVRIAPVFATDASGLHFDLARSVPRPLSLAAKFPLRLTGFLCAAKPEAGVGTDGKALPAPPGQTPQSLGYAPVVAPFDQAPLAAPWCGLVYTLDLGALGALAARGGISLTVLAGWSGAGGGAAFLGVRVPNAGDAGVAWPLQGVMRLGFRDFRFDAETSKDGLSRTYVLRLHRLALSLLGWSLPPGNVDAVLFGDPDGKGEGELGWYAAYSNT